MAMLRSAPRLVAVLGPTNTGKTHLAIERMLDHQTGMIGFPLRLLARENYDRVVKLRGARAVALITGEEKILPPNPSYFVCTVESMPLDRPVEFLAVDEIQLCADPERGHVFTARLLHARGLSETMFLGADTIRPLMRRLVPEAEYVSRPRFSTLSHTGHKKVTRLPPRSAVVAFAVADGVSVGALLQSLDERPRAPGLVQMRGADDHRSLQLLSRNAEISALATNPGAVRLLWEVCQIPDFRKVMSDSHARFLAHCFVHLAGPSERLPGQWVGAQMTQLDRLDGDIDTLMQRIAHIRTWTYITHRGDWLDSAADWQERARGVEDRLSDALHERITQRSVDRCSAF